MKRLIVGLVLAVGLTGLAYAQGDAQAGKSKATVCAGCHGADGNSAAGQFPKLAGQNEKYLLKQLHDIKGGKRKVLPMTGILDNMSDQDLQDLAAYFSSQTTTIGQADPKLAKAAAPLYRGGDLANNVPACAACHGPKGLGNNPAAYPRLSGQHPEYIETQLKNFRSGARNNDPNAMMRTIASKLTDTQIKALSQYVYGLH